MDNFDSDVRNVTAWVTSNRLGDYVMVTNNGDLVPGLITEVHSWPYVVVHCFGGHCEKKVHIDDIQNVPSMSGGNDDDFKMRTCKDVYSVMKKLLHKGYSKLEVFASKSDYTSVFDATFGHTDHFGNDSVMSLIENKMVCGIGTPDESVQEPNNIAIGTVPLGGLAYPRFKVSTTLSMEDLEMHVLHNVLHFGTTPGRKQCPLPKNLAGKSQNEKKKLKASYKRQLYDHVCEKRGCWMRGKFYPDGMALLDWTSRYNKMY